MVIKICTNCGTKTTNIKAYVGEQHLPLCEDCYKKFFQGEITLDYLKQKVKSNE